MTLMTILDEIFSHKREEVALQKQVKPPAELRAESEASPQPVSFVQTLQASTILSGRLALIAEVKFASPSRGVIVHHPDPLWLAEKYNQAGAAAISVLTDEKYFHGCLEYLRTIHHYLPTKPLLRKDFILDPYQVYEARAVGASAILLIAAYLDKFTLADLHALALELGLDAMIEVHDRIELENAVKVPGVALIGVNNRDLRTFEVNLQTCLDLRPFVPKMITFVAESGIHNREDVRRLSAAGVDAMLVGEALVTSHDVVQTIQDLYGREA
jgi:indole-3-glycerol phosphate synthase